MDLIKRLQATGRRIFRRCKYQANEIILFCVDENKMRCRIQKGNYFSETEQNNKAPCKETGRLELRCL